MVLVSWFCVRQILDTRIVARAACQNSTNGLIVNARHAHFDSKLRPFVIKTIGLKCSPGCTRRAKNKMKIILR